MPLGVNLTFQNKKNRSFTPFLGVSEIQLYFKNGINPLGGLLGALLTADRIEKSGRGKYRVKEAWADGQDIEFASTEEKNDVPAETLIQCPKLVDADSAEQIQEYLKIYAPALDLALSDTTQEKELSDEEADVEFDLSSLAKGDESEDEE